MLKLNKFEGKGACRFKATANKARSGRVTLSTSSNLEHDATCPIASGKVKGKMLSKAGDNFKSTLEAHGYKANLKVMETEAAKAGLGGYTVSKDVMYSFQRRSRKKLNEDYEKQFAELPHFLRRLLHKNTGYSAVVLDSKGVFEHAFMSLGVAQDVIKIHGRPVCSTDFGHMKHDLFGGLNATGIFQLGDGRLIHLWSCIFAGSNESTWMWETCAKHIVEAGLEGCYHNAVHFRDRHAGCDHFESLLKIEYGMYCSAHILRNIREHRASNPEQALEKRFHDNMFWAVQGSSTADEYAINLLKFEFNFPRTMAYIREIEPAKWVHFAQVAAGAATWGWRTNNASEIGQGNYLQNLRNMNVLRYFSSLAFKTFDVIELAARDHQTWQAQVQAYAVTDLVPHGLKLYTDRTKAASKCVVKKIATTGVVKYHDPSQSFDHPERVVNLATKTCSCLEWQMTRFPCKCAIALASASGKAPNIFVSEVAHKSYKICARELDTVSKLCVFVLPPTSEELLERSGSAETIVREIEAAEEEDAGPPAGKCIVPEVVIAPPRRYKEGHGNSKRKRKRTGQPAASTGRTMTRTFTAAVQADESTKNDARQTCANCRKAGRTDIERHKSSLCPYQDGLAATAVECILVLSATDSEDNGEGGAAAVGGAAAEP
jgi:hypothetical protein